MLAQAIEEARALGAAGPRARAEIARILLLAATDTEWSAQEASAEGERIVAALEGTGDDRTLAKAWSLVGQAPLFLTRYAEMDRAMSRSLEYAERANDPQQRSEAIVWLAVAIASGPARVEEGIARLERLRERVPEGSHAEAGLLVNLATLHALAGRIEQARTLVGRGRAIFKELGMELIWAAFAMEQAWVELHAGDPAVAEPSLREACEALQRMGERSFLSTASAMLAQTLYTLGRHEEVEGWTRVSEEEASPEDIPSQVMWRSVRAKVLARRGELEDAEQLAREAVTLAETGDDVTFIGDTLLDLAEVLGLAGEVDEQRVCLERALALYERKGAVRLAEQSRALLAQLAPEA